MSLLDLAARVEGATGPDRELDAEIWLAITPGATRKETVIPANGTRRGWTIDEARDEGGRLIIVPAYMQSLDAALTLVPSECAVSTGHAADGDPYHYVTFLSITDYATDEETEFEGRSNNWAASIVAAALRARAGASS